MQHAREERGALSALETVHTVARATPVMLWLASAGATHAGRVRCVIQVGSMMKVSHPFMQIIYLSSHSIQYSSIGIRLLCTVFASWTEGKGTLWLSTKVNCSDWGSSVMHGAKRKAKVFNFTSWPFQANADLLRGGGVKKNLYLGGVRTWDFWSTVFNHLATVSTGIGLTKLHIDVVGIHSRSSNSTW